MPEHYRRECVALCEARLKKADQAHNRCSLAQAYGLVGENLKAEEQLRAALRQTPDSFWVKLLLAEAGRWLAQTQRAAASSNYLVDWLLARAVFYALAGDVEKARADLERVGHSDPKNQRAKNILSALNGH